MTSRVAQIDRVRSLEGEETMKLEWEGQLSIPNTLARQVPCANEAKWHIVADNAAYTRCGRQLRRDLEYKRTQYIRVGDVCLTCLAESHLVAK